MKFKIPMMIVLTATTLAAQAAPRPILACRVTQLVDETLLEEGLDTGDNSEITIERTFRGKEARVGAALYAEADGDSIEFVRTPVGQIVSIHAKDSDEVITLVLSGVLGREKGRLDVKRSARSKARTAARIDCGTERDSAED